MGRYLQLQKRVLSVNVCWWVCFLLCQDINALMYLGTKYWKKQKRSLWLVSASSQVRLGDVCRVRDICWVFLCFSELSAWVKPGSSEPLHSCWGWKCCCMVLSQALSLWKVSFLTVWWSCILIFIFYTALVCTSCVLSVSNSLCIYLVAKLIK